MNKITIRLTDNQVALLEKCNVNIEEFLTKKINSKVRRCSEKVYTENGIKMLENFDEVKKNIDNPNLTKEEMFEQLKIVCSRVGHAIHSDYISFNNDLKNKVDYLVEKLHELNKRFTQSELDKLGIGYVEMGIRTALMTKENK